MSGKIHHTVPFKQMHQDLSGYEKDAKINLRLLGIWLWTSRAGKVLTFWGTELWGVTWSLNVTRFDLEGDQETPSSCVAHRKSWSSLFRMKTWLQTKNVSEHFCWSGSFFPLRSQTPSRSEDLSQKYTPWVCHRPNWTLPTPYKFLCESANPQGNGIWWWGLWEIVTFGGDQYSGAFLVGLAPL